MDTQKNIAKFINIVGAMLYIGIAWQAIRFYNGSIGAPLVDQLMHMIETLTAVQQPTVINEMNEFFQKVFYYLFGISIWLVLALIVKNITWSIARIVEVGYAQYQAEIKQAREESERLALIENARARRRERRRLKMEAQGKKPAFSYGALLVGLTIGTIFF